MLLSFISFILMFQASPVVSLEISKTEIKMGSNRFQICRYFFQGKTVYGLETHQLFHSNNPTLGHKTVPSLPLQGPIRLMDFNEETIKMCLTNKNRPSLKLAREPKSAFLFKNNALYAVYVSDWEADENFYYRLFTQNGEILLQYPLQFQVTNIDQENARVFDPNPVVTSGDTQL